MEDSEKRPGLEQRLLKEMLNEREFVKKQLFEVKEKILVIAKAENAKKRRQKKKKKKKTFKFTKKLFEGEKNGVLNKRTWKHSFG